jgi:hypothetical protein
MLPRAAVEWSDAGSWYVGRGIPALAISRTHGEARRRRLVRDANEPLEVLRLGLVVVALASRCAGGAVTPDAAIGKPSPAGAGSAR